MSNEISMAQKLVESDFKISDLMNRDESILILPNNTLRFIDLPLQVEIYNAEDRQTNLTMDQLIYRLTCRKEKSIAKMNDVDDTILDNLFRLNYQFYYAAAPATELYSMLDLLPHQKFVKNITVLFDDERVEEDPNFASTEYYDGTYNGLVEYLKSHKFTCLILSDVDLLDKLTKEKDLDFNFKTILISRIGHNYYEDSNGCVLLRKYEEIKDRFVMEIYTFCLFQFGEDSTGGSL